MDSLLKQILHSVESITERLAAIESRLPTPLAKRSPVVLDSKLIASFAAWSSKERHNSKPWQRRQRTYLAWWAEVLDDRDLRAISVAEHVLPALDGAPSKPQRIAVLKCLYSWLRTVRHQLTAAEDPTLDTLSVPQAKPAQDRIIKAVARKHYLAVRPHLKQRPRDGLDVLAATGWHVSELERFIRGGEVSGSVLTSPRGKGGKVIRNRGSRQTIAAAKRLLRCRKWSEKAFREAIAEACRQASRELIRPGRMRHSVATFAHNKGEDLAAIADSLHHRSKVTTMNFYATHAVPRKVRNLLDG